MGLLSRITQKRAERAFQPPEYFSGVNRVGLIDSGNQPAKTNLLGAVQGWQAIAAKAIADRIASLDLEVMTRRREQAGTVVEETLDDHPLLLTFQGNPVFSQRQLLSLISYWITQTGEAYLLKVTDRLRVPRELWPMPPDRMELRGDRDRVIGGYVFHGDGGDVFFEKEEVIRIWRPDPASIFSSLGTLGPQAKAYDASQFIDETVRTHYQRDAIPKVALKFDKDSVPPDAAGQARFLRDWRNRYDRRNGTMSGLPAFLMPGVEPHEFSTSVDDSTAVMDAFRDRILMAHGVPRSILGDVVDANRAAAETNQFVFDQHAVTPQADLIAESLTIQLARDFDPNIFVRFADFVSQDKAHELAQEGQDLTLKVRSVNQVREDRGLDPVDWGEEPIGGFGDKPYRPDEELSEDNPFAMDDPEEDPEDAEPRGRKALPQPFSTESAWAAFLSREKRWQLPFERAIRQVISEQRDATLERVSELEPRSRDFLDDLFRTIEWARIFRRIVEPIRRRAFLETVQETLSGLGVLQEFHFEPRVEAILERQAAELVKNTTDTTRRQLRSEVTQGVAAGEGVDQIAKRIRGVFRTRRKHARTIARTEVLKATSQAQEEGFVASGVVARHRWNTSLDAKVRDSHAAANGQVRDLNEPFTLGDGELASAPGNGHGGRTLSAHNSINCRCFVTPLFEGEE